MSAAPGGTGPSREDVEKLAERLDREAESAGYHLNPDRAFTLGLVEGLLVNEQRHGYWACPCRLPAGVKAEDLDIICPCDYRDADLAEFGSCYCALYVSRDISEGRAKAHRVPERRPDPPPLPPSAGLPPSAAASPGTPPASTVAGVLAPATPPRGAPMEPSLPVWRCRVCGYLCAREQPPEVCPICKAKKDRFERFL